MSLVPPPQPDDVVCWVTVRLHQGGHLSTSGTIANKRLTLEMLGHAIDAIKGRMPEDGALIIPGRDVSAMPAYPTRDIGDIPAGDRGDP